MSPARKTLRHPKAHERAARAALPRTSTNPEWFKERLKVLGVSQRQAAARIIDPWGKPIDPSRLVRIIAGENPARIEECQQLAAILGVSPREVMANLGMPDIEDPSDVRIVGTIAADGVAVIDWDRLSTARVPAPPGCPPDARGLTMMAGAEYAGATVIVRLPEPATLSHLGKHGVITTPSGAQWYGKLHRAAGVGRFDLHIAGHALEDVAVATFAPALWIKL